MAIIKRNAQFCGYAVVMLSSKDGVFDKARGRMVGAQDYLTKPFTKDQLLQAVQQFGQSRSRSDVMAIQKVLIVDDSKTELMFLTDLLQKNGMQVRTAENADEAFRRLAEEKPDLILMDVVMPGQNGFQLTRAINRATRCTPIFPSSCAPAKTWRPTVCGACARARVDYITKPVDAAELFAKIKALG